MTSLETVIENTRKVLDSKEIHEKHLPHAAGHILVKKLGKDEFYLRRRPFTKPVYPGYWTSSVGVHVLPGQTAQIAAKEGLKSFLSLGGDIVRLGAASVEDKVENERVTFYLFETLKEPKLNLEEGEEARFMSRSEIQELMKQEPSTPHLAAALTQYDSYVSGSSSNSI